PGVPRAGRPKGLPTPPPVRPAEPNRRSRPLSVPRRIPSMTTPLRIAQVAPPIERVPPEGYGGTERVVYELVKELVARGHDVTTFASGDSRVPGKLIPT